MVPDQDVEVCVDSEVCIGSGMCEMLEEGTFSIDEDTNVAVVMSGRTLSAERAATVIDRCPSGAIRLR